MEHVGLGGGAGSVQDQKREPSWHRTDRHRLGLERRRRAPLAASRWIEAGAGHLHDSTTLAPSLPSLNQQRRSWRLRDARRPDLLLRGLDPPSPKKNGAPHSRMGWDGADWNQEGETGERVERDGRGKS